MHNACFFLVFFYDLLTVVLVVGNPKGSIRWFLDDLHDGKDGKKNASAIQNNIVTCIIICLFFRLIPFVGLCYFYKLNNQNGKKKKKKFI